MSFLRTSGVFFGYFTGGLGSGRIFALQSWPWPYSISVITEHRPLIQANCGNYPCAPYGVTARALTRKGGYPQRKKMRITPTQRRTVERGLHRDGVKERKRNVLIGTKGRQLWAVMFLGVTEHFILGGFFSRSPPLPFGPPATNHPHPLSLSASRAPCCKPDLLVLSSVPSDKSWEWGPRWLGCGVRRWREKRKERTDGLEEEEEEGCRWAQQPCVQQTGYWWCLFLTGLYLCRGQILLGVT